MGVLEQMIDRTLRNREDRFGALDLFDPLLPLRLRSDVELPGQEKPRVRVRYITHPQRSYQDVQNELAVELANLPRFTAYTSIQGEQHRLRLNPPAKGGIDEERIERIRQTSKTWFGRPPEEPPAPPVAPEEPPKEPTGLGITRRYQREG